MAIFQDNPSKMVPYHNVSILDFVHANGDGVAGNKLCGGLAYPHRAEAQLASRTACLL